MKKLLVIPFIVFVAFSLKVSQVFADNDDPSIPVCNVSVNGVSLSSNSSSAPVIQASHVVPGSGGIGDRWIYPFRICGDTSLFSTLSPGVNPVIYFNYGNFDFNFGVPDKIDLRYDGECWVGEFARNMNNVTGPTNAVFDVEGDLGSGNPNNTPVCRRVYGRIAPTVVTEKPTVDWEAGFNMCSSVSINPANPVHNDTVTVSWEVPSAFSGNEVTSPDGSQYVLRYHLVGFEKQNEVDQMNLSPNDGTTSTYSKTTTLLAGTYQARFVLHSLIGRPEVQVCEKNFTVGTPNDPGEILTSEPESFDLCKQAGPDGSTSRTNCNDCMKTKGIWTAVGCIPFSDSTKLVRSLIVIGLGLAGAVVVLMVLAGGFLLSTSRGEPARVDEAKSLITSAIAGIFFLIFSVTILQFIGVQILRLPDFG